MYINMTVAFLRRTLRRRSREKVPGQRQLDLHPDQMQQVKGRTPRTLAWTAACFPMRPGPTRILLATGRQDFLGTTGWFSSPCLFSPFAFLFPFFFYPYPVTARQVFEFVRQTGNLKGEVWRKIVHLPEATEEVAGRQLRAEVAQISGCSEKK